MFLNLTFIHDAFDIGNPSGVHKVFVSEFFPMESSWDLSLKNPSQKKKPSLKENPSNKPLSKKPPPKKPLSEKKNSL